MNHELKIKVELSKERYDELIKCEQVAILFGQAMTYGGWRWETPTERVIEMLMRELGLYPMNEHKGVPEELYSKSVEVIPVPKHFRGLKSRMDHVQINGGGNSEI